MLMLFVCEAFAGGGGEEVSMMPLLFGLMLLSMSYLAAHFVVDRLQKRYLFVSGIEYVALGVGLSYIAVFDNSSTYLPAITFAVGWVGLTYGLKLSLSQIARSGAMLRLALTELVFVGVGVGAFVTFVMHSLFDQEWSICLLCGGMMGSAALATSSSAIEVVQQRYPLLKSHILTSLLKATQVSNLLAILVFSLVICTYNRDTLAPNLYENAQLGGGGVLTGLTLVGGLLLSVLYALFLVSNDSENSRFLALAGIICFAAGAAFFVNLPVLALTLALGLGVAQTQHKNSVLEMMEGAKKPAMLILLIFAGVQIKNISIGNVAMLLFSVVILRFLLKAFSSWVCGYGSSIRSDLFRGNLSQGIISLAIALSFRGMVEGEAVDLVYAVAVLSVAINELISPRWLRGLLIDIGEIRDEVSFAQEG